MKKEGIDMDKINDIINADIGFNKYEPSADFVDSLMDRIETIEVNQSRSYSLLFKTAAAIAVLFLLANLSVLLFNNSSTTSPDIMDEWVGLYQQDSGDSWYSSDDLEMLATLTIRKEKDE